MARAGNWRRFRPSEKTRGGSALMRSSMPTWRSWLWITCVTSSRTRLPAVVVISSDRRSPLALWRTPFLMSEKPASSRSLRAAAAS